MTLKLNLSGTIICSLFLASILFCIPNKALAQTVPPIPKAKSEIFEDLEQRLEQQKNEAAELQQKTKEETRELKKLQDQSITVSEKIQKNESLLHELSNKIQSNETRQAELEHILDQNRKRLSENLLAAIRMRRIPSETLLLQTNSPLTTAQTALMLKDTLPGIQSHMNKVSMAANELKEVQDSLIEDKRSQEIALKNLSNEQIELTSLIKKRQKIIEKTKTSYALTQTEIQNLTSESKSLQELISRIENINAAQEKKRQEMKMAQIQTQTSLSPPPSVQPSRKTSVHRSKQEMAPPGWPAAGAISIRYGETDIYGAPSQGIKIETRSGALVTTPISGTVRYAGAFKSYGQLLIIEHNSGWHSLIAGLSRIDAAVGQGLQKGEPVGMMSTQKKQPILYYELRYQGKPVNPAKRIKELS